MSEFAYEFAHWDLFGVTLIRQTIPIEYNNLQKIDKIRYIFTWEFKYIGLNIQKINKYITRNRTISFFGMGQNWHIS